MGCQNGKQSSSQTLPCQLTMKKGKNSSSQPSLSSIVDCETVDMDHSVNRVCVLEQCCVTVKIQLQNDYKAIIEPFKKENKEKKISKKLQDKADIIKLLINLADEIQERCYQLFDKDLKEEPKLEEFIISLIWACKKLKFKYIENFLQKIKPFFHQYELDFSKVNSNIKILIKQQK